MKGTCHAVHAASPAAPRARDSFPRAPLLGAGGLICFALLMASVGRLTGMGAAQPTSTPISDRYLRFEDRADGAVLVYDAKADPTDLGARPIDVETGQNGFLRGTLRGFARTRRADRVSPDAPFHLTAWADGRLTLEDPSTGRHADLEAFGPANAPVFAHFLIPPASWKSAAATTAAPMAVPAMTPSRMIEVACLVEIEQTAESFHAHAIPQDIAIRPGDSVLVHGAPTQIAFGDRICVPCRATVTRAGWIRRLWTQATGMLELTELYEVGFAPKETP